MDIQVTISTTIDKPLDRWAAGLVATLNAALKTANKWSVFDALETKYGKANADYLIDLLPTIGEVQSVEFVPAAAGEEKETSGPIRSKRSYHTPTTRARHSH